jgi:hypothetical protein
MAETRKLRSDLTAEELERLQKFGSLSFTSIRRVDHRVEKFIPSKDQHWIPAAEPDNTAAPAGATNTDEGLTTAKEEALHHG